MWGPPWVSLLWNVHLTPYINSPTSKCNSGPPQIPQPESHKTHRWKIRLFFLNGRCHTAFSRGEILFLPFSQWEVRPAAHNSCTSSPDTLIPSAPAAGAGKSEWTQSAPELFLNALQGQHCLPGQLLPAFDVNPPYQGTVC